MSHQAPNVFPLALWMVVGHQCSFVKEQEYRDRSLRHSECDDAWMVLGGGLVPKSLA